MNFTIEEFSISNFRSISTLTVKPNKSGLLTICGANNVGKTNFLRALKLFFEAKVENFDPSCDIPFHIAEGTQGGGYKTTLKIRIRDNRSNDIYKITQVYSRRNNENTFLIEGHKNSQKITPKEILTFLEKNFLFFFVEASNINIPELISAIVKDDILPIALDRRRGAGQKESLDKLEDFIKKSKEVVEKIEKELTVIFKDIFSTIDSIDSENWKLKILFPEYNFLREAISNMISFTLSDSNDRELESKGSGIQRIILLSLIQYLNKKTSKNIIWAIDEPEAFLQPSLQKSLYSKLLSESEKNQIILATHSTFFIDLENLENTFLFEGTKEIKDTYTRIKNKVFYRVNVVIDYSLSNSEKALKIKNHFGILKNDSWEIMPFNILVEGKEDKDYLTAIFNLYNIQTPNFLVAGGVDKYKGYLQYIDDFCSELKKKPKVVAIFDRDKAKDVYNSLNSARGKEKLSNIELSNFLITRFDGASHDNIEIEDFIPTDIIIDAANKILRRKKYGGIRANDRLKRTQSAYNRNPILEFLREITKSNNTDKVEIEFDSLHMKLALCDNVCKAMYSDEKTQKMIRENIKIREFIEQITNTSH
jgi:AAA15 family ATPase/GTPase